MRDFERKYYANKKAVGDAAPKAAKPADTGAASSATEKIKKKLTIAELEKLERTAEPPVPPKEDEALATSPIESLSEGLSDLIKKRLREAYERGILVGQAKAVTSAAEAEEKLKGLYEEAYRLKEDGTIYPLSEIEADALERVRKMNIFEAGFYNRFRDLFVKV